MSNSNVLGSGAFDIDNDSEATSYYKKLTKDVVD